MGAIRELRLRLSRLSLQTKLIVSYLGVALGAILLVIVISVLVQNYFNSAQRDELRSQAEYLAQKVGIIYFNHGEDWTNVGSIAYYNSQLFVVLDANQQVHSTEPPGIPRLSDGDIFTLNTAMLQSLQGREVSGTFQGIGNDQDGDVFTGNFISVPIYDNGQQSGKPVGALLLAQPDRYPTGFSPKDVLATLNTLLIVAGVAITGIVLLFGIFMARRFTRPLASLTHAAERMKAGDYSQRVDTLDRQDEIGALSLTFNAMADKIESDVNELRLQEQLRRDMIANIAHDLVTPLTAIQGFSEAMADEVIYDPQARQETAQLIGREVQRLRRLVSDMQHMTTLESGRVQLELAPLDMRALVDEVLAVIGPECEQAGITLRNAIAPGAPKTLADSDRITQVLLNLLDNARRHTPAGGSITIDASVIADTPGGPGISGRKWLEVAVHDSGSGINAADLPFIFDRFFRSDRARTGQKRGSGLGLSIVKAIITAHGGTIRAESAPGQGTRIVFTLPVADGKFPTK
ncbi:MAG TPA: HAMP domain-containing sensor histidine kinase [Ktedonobacteraceae bacterium]|nr:HAMP domain-containing sensor histidine kinase [Ktedonobacteraceae bacterium]